MKELTLTELEKEYLRAAIVAAEAAELAEADPETYGDAYEEAEEKLARLSREIRERKSA